MAHADAPLAEWTPRRTMIATIVVGAVCLAFFLLYLLQSVVFLLFVGVVIATALNPLIELLERLGIGRASAVAIVYAVLVILLVIVVAAGLPLVVDQLSAMIGEAPKYYETVRDALLRLPSDLLRRLAGRLPETVFSPAATGGEAPIAVSPLETVTQALSYGQPVLHGLLALVAALLFAFYWSLQEERSVRAVLLLVPAPKRDDARNLFESMQSKVGAYLRGQGLLCLVVGGLNFTAFLIIGLPYAVTLGIVAGLCEAIPMFGPVLGAIPAAIVAFSVDPSKVIWVGVAALLIQQAENYLLVPRVMDRSVGVNPVVTLLAIAGFGSVFGFAGAILAIPLAAIVQVLLERFVFSSEALEPKPLQGRDATSLLRYQARELIHDMRLQTRKAKSDTESITVPIEEELESIALDLDRELLDGQEEVAAAQQNGADEEEA